MSMHDKNIDIKRGLRGVYIDSTESSFIGWYQLESFCTEDYSIHELAAYSTFEEVAYLLLYGKLPTQKEFDDFNVVLSGNRKLPEEVVKIINLVQRGHPMRCSSYGRIGLSRFLLG